MGDETRSLGHRVLICAPFGQDAATMAGILAEHAYEAWVCGDLDDIAARFDDDTGLILLTQESMSYGLDALQKRLQGQPAWSDVPFIVLTARSTGRLAPADQIRERLLELTANAVVLERPLGVASLLSAARSAIRARQRQFEMRDRLRELNVQYNRLDTLLKHLPIGVAFVDRDHSTIISNPAFLRFRPNGTVASNDPLSDQEWHAVDERGRRLSRAEYPVSRALKGERVTETEFCFSPATGPPLWTRVSAVPLRDEQGSIAGAIAVIVDVDEIKRAQAALAQFAARLEEQVLARTAELQDALRKLKAEQSDRERAEASLHQSQKMEAVGQLTGGIAHDFNNMLTGIIGALDITRRRIASGRIEEVHRFMDAAAASAQRAAALTQRLLAFSRRQSLDAQPVAVNDLIAHMKDLLDRAINERITLKMPLAPEIPNAVIDAHQLESAILNLAINARDAMPAGGTLTIETARCEMGETEAATQGIAMGSYVVICVQDTGVGMPPEVLEKVFEPFFTTKPMGQGTGLGLSMVYGFAKQSGGCVKIESTPNVGTAVRLFLPTTAAAPAAAGDVPSTIARGAGERVLVVEDDEGVLMLIREVLKELDYEPIEFADPLQALPLLSANERIDLMVSDVGLPEMNGRQLAEVARQHRPDLPILFITGYAENAVIRADFLGANMTMLQKPFSVDALSNRIRQMIERSNAGQFRP